MIDQDVLCGKIPMLENILEVVFPNQNTRLHLPGNFLKYLEPLYPSGFSVKVCCFRFSSISIKIYVRCCFLTTGKSSMGNYRNPVMSMPSPETGRHEIPAVQSFSQSKILAFPAHFSQNSLPVQKLKLRSESFQQGQADRIPF